MNYTSISVIYNPNSTGSSESLARTFQRDLQKRIPKQNVDLYATQHAGHAKEIAYSLAKKSPHALIISSSGDGGYHEVINGIMKARKEGSRAIAGLLPAGNANDHYRNVHDKDLIERVIAGEYQQVDLLELHARSEGKKIHRYSHSYIGFGLTPVVGKELNKNKLNPLNEALIVGKALINLHPVKLIIKRKPRYYDSVIFSNVDSMSKYLKISQPSKIDDGKFEVTIFQTRSKLKLIGLLLKASVAGVSEDTQVKKFKLKTVKETLVQADGEIIELDANSSVKVTIKKRALSCVV